LLGKFLGLAIAKVNPENNIKLSVKIFLIVLIFIRDKQ